MWTRCCLWWLWLAALTVSATCRTVRGSIPAFSDTAESSLGAPDEKAQKKIELLWDTCSLRNVTLKIFKFFKSVQKKNSFSSARTGWETVTGFIRGILRGVRYAKSLRVLFLHRRSPSWTTLVLYSRVVFIFNEPTKFSYCFSWVWKHHVPAAWDKHTECTVFTSSYCNAHWGRRLEGWPSTAARLAGWRRVTQQGGISYVRDGPYRLPWRTSIPLDPV